MTTTVVQIAKFIYGFHRSYRRSRIRNPDYSTCQEKAPQSALLQRAMPVNQVKFNLHLSKALLTPPKAGTMIRIPSCREEIAPPPSISVPSPSIQHILVCLRPHLASKKCPWVTSVLFQGKTITALSTLILRMP